MILAGALLILAGLMMGVVIRLCKLKIGWVFRLDGLLLPMWILLCYCVGLLPNS